MVLNKKNGCTTHLQWNLMNVLSTGLFEVKSLEDYLAIFSNKIPAPDNSRIFANY